MGFKGKVCIYEKWRTRQKRKLPHGSLRTCHGPCHGTWELRRSGKNNAAIQAWCNNPKCSDWGRQENSFTISHKTERDTLLSDKKHHESMALAGKPDGKSWWSSGGFIYKKLPCGILPQESILCWPWPINVVELVPQWGHALTAEEPQPACEQVSLIPALCGEMHPVKLLETPFPFSLTNESAGSESSFLLAETDHPYC